MHGMCESSHSLQLLCCRQNKQHSGAVCVCDSSCMGQVSGLQIQHQVQLIRGYLIKRKLTLQLLCHLPVYVLFTIATLATA